MTNNELRGQIVSQLLYVTNAQEILDDADDTPANNNMIVLANQAARSLRSTYDNIPANGQAISEWVANAYKTANRDYKVIKSTFTEFGADSWPSFADAIADSVKELPSTIGGALGAVPNAVGSVISEAISAFFSKLSIVGWLALIAALILVACYFFPQLPLAMRGLFYKAS